jgi:hypothetical protein
VLQIISHSSGPDVFEPTNYTLCGVRIRSDFPLVGVPLWSNAVPSLPEEIVIHRAQLPVELASTTLTFRNGQYVGTYNGSEIFVDVAGVGRFLVRSGKDIIVDPAPCSDGDEMRAWLLGTAFALLCHQRGMTPLHASAIDVTGGSVAFVGGSGDGKSTLAAALSKRGYPVICDDICFLRRGTENEIQVWPGLNRLRLWEDARVALGFDETTLERETYGCNKYFIPVVTPHDSCRPRSLIRVYQLCPATAVEIAPLRGAAAIEVLLENIFGRVGVERIGRKPQAFAACAAAAQEVQMFRFSRPLDYDAFDKSIDLLEDHLRSPP